VVSIKPPKDPVPYSEKEVSNALTLDAVIAPVVNGTLSLKVAEAKLNLAPEGLLSERLSATNETLSVTYFIAADPIGKSPTQELAATAVPAKAIGRTPASSLKPTEHVAQVEVADMDKQANANEFTGTKWQSAPLKAELNRQNLFTLSTPPSLKGLTPGTYEFVVTAEISSQGSLLRTITFSLGKISITQ
jgi:hypothetical protein